MKKKTLLQKAKQSKKRDISKVDEQQIELALAWAKDEIGFQQVVNALGVPMSPSSVYSRLAIGLKAYIQKTKT